MTSPFDALLSAAQAAQQAGQQLQQIADSLTAQVASLEAENASQAAQIQQLEAELHPTPQPQPQPQPQGTVWGVNATSPADLARREAALGKVGVVRFYDQPGKGVQWPAGMNLGPRTLVYSAKVTPQDTLAGKADAGWAAFAKAAPTDRDTYACVWHEPEDNIAAGQFTAAQLAQAFAHVAGIVRPINPRIKLTTILMGYSLLPASHRNWRDYYPGDAACDVIAWDTYQQSPTYPAAPGQLYAAGAAAAKSVGKPWAVAETGINSTFTGQARAQTLTAMAKAAAGAVFVCYFDNPPWGITGDPASVAAWKAGQA